MSTSKKLKAAAVSAGSGLEARVVASDHAALKLWLRLLSSTREIEGEIRKRLREQHGVSLARFDYLAQLHRRPEGLRMRELSKALMVTGGNVTGLTDELEREGLVTRLADAADRRVWVVRLTPEGQRSFEAMAAEHEGWIVELFAGLSAPELRQMYGLLGTLRQHLQDNESIE